LKYLRFSKWKEKIKVSLVYINDTLSKGEVGTDMKSILPSAIERVEVLRDGAFNTNRCDWEAGSEYYSLK
jgi:hypothetical protein